MIPLPKLPAEHDDFLRALNAELAAALARCLSHFERIQDQQAEPRDSSMMAQARAALAKLGEGT